MEYISQCCRNKGSFPIGTGQGQIGNMDYALPLLAPTDGLGNILPGYTLQTNATSYNGLAWNYTGTGNSIKRYRFPSGTTPEPFPSPAVADTQYALIVREDIQSTNTGLIDLEMPVLGPLGKIPIHGIPTQTWAEGTYDFTFFFDTANQSVNVFEASTKTWTMGWLRFPISVTFNCAVVWAGYAGYAAPWDTPGLIISGNFLQYTDAGTGLPVSANTGFIFVELYNTTNIINPPVFVNVLPNITGTANAVNITALCALDQTYWGALGTPYVLAYAIGNQNSLTNFKSCWGFISELNVYRNSDLTAVNTATYYFGSGICRTISSNDDSTQLFLGGDYQNIYTNGIFVSRITTAGFLQRAFVAMVNTRTAPTVNITANSYVFIGDNANTVPASKNWSGLVAQSNWSSDDFFYLSGSFVSPPTSDAVIPASSSPPGPSVATVAVYQTTTAVSADIEQSLYTQYTTNVTLTPQQTTANGIFGALDSVRILQPLAYVNNVSTQLPLAGPGVLFDYQINEQSSLNPLTEIWSANYSGATSQTIALNTPYTMTAYPTGDYMNSFYFSWLALAITVPQTTSATLSVQLLGNGNVLYDFTNTQIFSINTWTTIPVLGGGIGGNLMNTDRAIGGATFPGGNQQISFQIRFTQTSGTPLSMLFDQNGIPEWYLMGYSKYTNPAANPLAYSNSYYAGGNFTVGAGPSPIYGLMYFTNVSLTLRTLTTAAPNSRLACSLIPINTPQNQQIVLNYVVPTPIPSPEPPTNTAVLQFDLIKNTTLVAVINSAYFRADVPIQLTQIPKLTGGPPNQPTFSEYGVSTRSIYKCGWALSPTQPGFGVYNGEVVKSFGTYTLRVGVVPTAGFYRYNNVVQNNATAITFAAIDNQGVNNTSLFNKMNAGDTIILSDGTIQQLWIVQGGQPMPSGTNFVVSVLPAPNYVNTDFVDFTVVTTTADLFATQQNAPKILSDSLGAYFINRGGSSLEEVMLCSVQATAKAYKYVPLGFNNTLAFDTRVQVPAPLVNNVVSADSVTFNNNYSNILLSASDKNPDEWFLISSSGNVGFTNN